MVKIKTVVNFGNVKFIFIELLQYIIILFLDYPIWYIYIYIYIHIYSIYFKYNKPCAFGFL